MFEKYGGFRTDLQLSSRDTLVIEGDGYQGDLHQFEDDIVILTPPYAASLQMQTALGGGDLLTRWTRNYSATSAMSVQAYYSGDTRSNVTLGSFTQAADVEFEDRFSLNTRNDIVWGAGYRWTDSQFENTFQRSFFPANQGVSLSNVFAQDEIAIVPGRFHFIVGSKFEDAPYTGLNVQPNGRLLWTPTKRQTLWASLAMAQATPDREDQDSVTAEAAFPGPSGIPTVQTVFGDTDTKNQKVLSFEAGYRVQVFDRVSLDFATFYSHYKDLSSIDAGTPFLAIAPAPTHFVFPSDFGNQVHGKGYGAELSAQCQVTRPWKLIAGYTYLGLQFHTDPGASNAVSELDATQSPHNQFQLRSQWNLPRKFEFDQSVFFVSGISSGQVPAYTRADARLGWQPGEALEFSIVGQNLLSPRHLEFPDFEQYTSSQDVRKVFAKVTWRF
jgi:iron complex outermembrane receptor protein